MYGISSQSKEQIGKAVANLFDRVALRLIGNIPKLQQKKVFLVGFEENLNLANLFVQALGNKWLNNVEQDVIKSILEGTYSYIDILKNKTSNQIVNRIEGLAREARISGDKVPDSEINKIMEEELEKARSGLETIAMSEGTKARNLGMTMDITRAAASTGDTDPVIGFAGINDNSICEQCVRLFLMPDKVTPRLWKLSECSAGYFKRGDSVPSILGLHPRCRHTPFMVPSDWGFNKSGQITFIKIGYNALESQRAGT